jgi:hypothetical protein
MTQMELSEQAEYWGLVCSERSRVTHNGRRVGVDLEDSDV